MVKRRKNKKSQPHMGWLLCWPDDDLQAKLLGKRRLALERDARYLAELLDPRVERFHGGLAVWRGLNRRADGGLLRLEGGGKGIERGNSGGDGRTGSSVGRVGRSKNV